MQSGGVKTRSRKNISIYSKSNKSSKNSKNSKSSKSKTIRALQSRNGLIMIDYSNPKGKWTYKLSNKWYYDGSDSNLKRKQTDFLYGPAETIKQLLLSLKKQMDKVVEKGLIKSYKIKSKVRRITEKAIREYEEDMLWNKKHLMGGGNGQNNDSQNNDNQSEDDDSIILQNGQNNDNQSEDDDSIGSVFLFTKETSNHFELLPVDIPAGWRYLASGGSDWEVYPNEYQFRGPNETKQIFLQKLHDHTEQLTNDGVILSYLINDHYGIDNPYAERLQ